MPLHALFALGVYLSNPIAGNEGAFEASYASFVSTMGVAPQYIDSYVDGTQPIGNWPQSAGWQAYSNAQSPDARNLVPVVGLPMQSSAAGSPTSDKQFRAFAKGDYDSVIRGVVDAYAQQGFTRIVYRVGLEMNIDLQNYAGDDGTQSQIDWLHAFRRIYRVLHQEAAADHVRVEVMWNPDTTNYTNASATKNLYPGDEFVDVIGADMYADMYPYQDGYNSGLYHDWDTGQEDTSTAQFMADPINREHYWNYPAATEYSLDSSGGHSLSFAALIAFALQHNKPFAVPEAGSGNITAGNDINDDAAFPLWLAQTLVIAEAQGLKLEFVTIWDSNGSGNYEYSFPSDNKPEECAAWAKYFGAQPAAMGASSVPPVELGSGPDIMVMRVAEDAWNGDAQYTVSVDGTQVGGMLTATASYAAGQNQLVTLRGHWGAGRHTLTVNYLNDANDGTIEADRNLYVVDAGYNGKVLPRHTLFLLGGGSQSLTLGAE